MRNINARCLSRIIRSKFERESHGVDDRIIHRNSKIIHARRMLSTNETTGRNGGRNARAVAIFAFKNFPRNCRTAREPTYGASQFKAKTVRTPGTRMIDSDGKTDIEQRYCPLKDSMCRKKENGTHSVRPDGVFLAGIFKEARASCLFFLFLSSSVGLISLRPRFGTQQ